MPSNLSDISVQFLKGVGPARKTILANLGVCTVEDLLYLFPRRYEDRTRMTPLSKVTVGETQTVSGKIVAKGDRQSWFTRKHVYETVIDDGSGRIFAVWFNQPYLDRYFKPGMEVVLHGQVSVYKDRMQMVAPEYEIIDREDKNLSMGRIVPVYPLTRGITQRYLRKIIRGCLDQYQHEIFDDLPVPIRNKHRLANLRRALENIHFPESMPAQQEAHRRISFEEFFFFQISVLRRRLSLDAKAGIKHEVASDLAQRFSAGFPFTLTKAQLRVMDEIRRDMSKPSPMLRLLQGDVGSGKTIAALFGAVAACENGYQSGFMVPTEILARQHYENIHRLLADGEFKQIRCGLLISSLSPAQKQETLARLVCGEIDLLVGTHALLSEHVVFKNLSYLVIDEQHKFGVNQRALLATKGRPNPDILIMTATPIPRTLSMTLFGDLDISTIDELPAGRGKITTRSFSPERAPEVYAHVRREVEAGRQAYIIFPLVEESEKLDLKAAQTSFKNFQANEFKGLKLGLVHGQMKKDEADKVMQKFKNGETQILVATSVLEVGIDVANATVMVIEHAERFGLSQLHQLRGRIGRGTRDAQCFLIAQAVTEDAKRRLQALLSTTDGFKLAEEDLLIRGPGQYFGRHQHGLNELKFADPLTQLDILKLARAEAQEILDQDPQLIRPQNKVLGDIIHKRYPGYLDMVEAA